MIDRRSSAFRGAYYLARGLGFWLTALIGLIALAAVAFAVALPFAQQRVVEFPTARPTGWTIILVAVVGGSIAMVVIEVARRLLPLRGIFHARAMAGLFGDEEVHDSGLLLRGLSWYDMPLDELVAQVGARAEKQLAALEGGQGDLTSVDTEPLLGRLTGMSRVNLTRSLPVSSSTENQPTWRRRADPEKYRVVLGDEAELRSRLEAALDDLQITVGSRWRRYIRLSACLLATLISAMMLPLALGTTAYPSGGWLFLPSFFLLGGFTAWVLRDAVAAVENWRR